MAGVAPRTILVCAFPAVLSLLTYLWIRKKKKNNSIDTPDYSSINGSIKIQEISAKARTFTTVDSPRSEEDRCSAEMHVKEQPAESKMGTLEDSTTVDGLGKWGESQLSSESCGNAITCSSSIDKIEDSDYSDVADHLARLTVCENETDAEGEDPNESLVLTESHRNSLQSSSGSGIFTLPENAAADDTAIVACAVLPTGGGTPAIVVQSSLEETQLNGDFGLLPDLKLFDAESCTVQELQAGITIGSFDSVNYSEMDDLTDSPPHSTYSDVQSEGSSDSGKGGSDIQVGSDLSQTTTGEDAVLIYEFELPQDLCGRLIGRLGRHVSFIKSRSGANVFIKRHLFNPRIKICAVEGNQSEIKNALELIRKRFPLSQFPNVNLTQVNVPIPCGVMVPETLQLHLPDGVTSDVILSSMVSAGHFFVQQPTHPTYPSLNRLDQCMMVCYSQMETPELPQPVEVGVICAAPMMGGWYRASVVHVYENSEDCDVKFVDYGGYSCTSISSLRQIRSDFMTLPFQASECYLANVKPPDDNAGWSLEACATFEELAQGQILQSLIVAHADDGVPYVHLYRIQGVSTIFINRELVNRGVAQWVEHQM